MARSSARSQPEKQHQTTAIAVQVNNYSQVIEIGSSVPFAIKEILSESIYTLWKFSISCLYLWY